MPAARPLPIVLAALAAYGLIPLLNADDTDAVWRQLESPVYADREAATTALWSRGKSVRDRLATEAETGGLDKRERCRRLIRLIDLGLPISAKKPAVNAILAYEYDLPEDEKRRLIRAAVSVAAAGSPALLKLGLDEPVPACRQLLFAAGSVASGPYLGSLIEAGDTGRTELRRYVDAYLPYDHPVLGAIAALDVTLTDQAGETDARIAALLAKPNRNDAEDRVLITLFVLTGRTDEAERLAEANAQGGNGMDRAANALAVRSGDRTAVLARLGLPAQSTDVRIIARLIAGDAAGAGVLLDEEIRTNPPANAAGRSRIGQLNFLLGRVDAGMGDFSGLGEIGLLRAQGRWAEALSAKPPADGDTTPSRQRRDAELQQLRQDVGQLKPERPPRTSVALTPELQAAAAATKRNDAAAVVAATQGVTPGDRAAQSAALWLRAESLEQLNRTSEAKTARDTADLHAIVTQTGVPEALAKLDAVGLSDAADRVADRLSRRQADNAWLNALLADRSYRVAVRRKDWAAAVRSADDLLLWHTLGELTVTEPAGHLRMNHRRWLAAAQLAMDNGDTVKAIDCANTAVAYLPIDLAVPVAMVAKLRAADESAAADALFDRVWTRQLSLCRQFPKASSIRNTAAWMALRCDRNVAEALKLATEAVAFQPDNEAFLDTLAEAQFRNDRREQAVATMRRAQKLRPNDSVILARLKGFEQGKVVLPNED